MGEAFADHQDESPLLVIDLDVVVERWRRLSEQLDGVAVSYAVKANPAPEILEVLVGLGSTFDVVSPAEVDACLAAGADPARLSYGNTVKKRSAIRHAFAKGVRTFAFDCEGELDKLIDEAPGSTAVCRIRCDGAGAARPLSRKFGCRADRAAPLLRRAVAYGMVPAVSFHVGSQQFDPEAWDRALASVADVRAELRADGIELASVGLGGGLPGTYVDPTPPLEGYVEAIARAIRQRLGPEPPPEIVIVPSRYLVADAGVIRSQVVTVSRRDGLERKRWVHLDVGFFSGLPEVVDEAIRYRIVADGPPGRPSGPVAIAGPTCDSLDILYESTPYLLPLDLASEDHVHLLSTGAYTARCGSLGFNGFEPMAMVVLPPSDRMVWGPG